MENQKLKLEKSGHDKGLSVQQKALTFLIIMIWMVIFLGGILVNSGPYRDMISNHSYANVGDEQGTTGRPQNIYIAWVIVLLCYTPSNVVFLCMSAGLLGALSRIAKLHLKKESESELPSDKTNPLISGMLRGIFVYLLVISGILIINEAPFTQPSQIQYIRLAGFLSLLSFLLSYNPSRFRSFIAKGLDTAERKIQPGG